jgi:hypothetical protein
MSGRDEVDASLADDVGAFTTGNAAELRVHVLVNQVGIEQRDAARSQFEHRAKTRICRTPDDVGLASEQQRTHCGDEHGRIDGVREIAVTTGGQAMLVIVVSHESRRQVHDGKKCCVTARAQPAAHFQAIDVRQIDVEHDERHFLGSGKCIRTRGRFDHVKSAGTQDSRGGIQ